MLFFISYYFILLIITYGLKKAPFWEAAVDSWAPKSQQIQIFSHLSLLLPPNLFSLQAVGASGCS